MKRENQCGIRLSDEELSKIKELAKNDDRTVSYVVRSLVIKALRNETVCKAAANG